MAWGTHFFGATGLIFAKGFRVVPGLTWIADLAVALAGANGFVLTTVFASAFGLIFTAGLAGAVAITFATGWPLAKGFFCTTGFLRATNLDFSAASFFVLTFGLTTAHGFGFAADLIFAGTAVFEIFTANGPAFFTAAFFTADFFEDFAGVTFEVFAPGLTRLEVVRRKGDFAAVIFFGFFMATVLAIMARSLVEIKPGISGAQREFGLAIRMPTVLRRYLQIQIFEY